LKKYNPTVLATFLQKAERNLKGFRDYFTELNDKKYWGVPVHILDEDTRFKTTIPDESVDLIVTSPPYGDSKTTVAYGQYSRLSLQWLDFEDSICRSIDKISLGGNYPGDEAVLHVSKTLKRSWGEINKNRAYTISQRV